MKIDGDNARIFIDGVELGNIENFSMDEIEHNNKEPFDLKKSCGEISGTLTIKTKKNGYKKLYNSFFPNKEIRKYIKGFWRFAPWFLIPTDITNFATIDWFQAERVEPNIVK